MKATLIDFADALRTRRQLARQLQREARAKVRVPLALALDSTEGAFVLLTPDGGEFYLPERTLFQVARDVLWSACFLKLRRLEVARARSGRCALLHCSRRNWRRTGLCRGCLADLSRDRRAA